MQEVGGVRVGKGRERMEVWDSRAEGGAGEWSLSQDKCPSDAIYSSPSWAILTGPDHYHVLPFYFLYAHIQQKAGTHLVSIMSL